MINVTKTYLPDVEKYKSYVEKIFSSGWLTNNGQMVQELERRLSEFLGVKNLLLVSNGTLALQVAYKVLDLKGDVLTTPFSFVATTSSLVWEGLNPVFVDIDPDTFNMDPEKITDKITKSTSAIVPVHVFGNICDVEKIEEIARRNKLKVIYDAAHAFNVSLNGQSAANYGDISTFSFHSTKVFHTIEGGAIVVKDDDLFKRAKLMINFGIPGPDRVTELGINCKMNEFQAAMGLCVLEDMEMILTHRKKIYNKYCHAFNNNAHIKVQKLNAKASQNYSYFPVVFDSEDVLLNVRGALNKEGIFPRRYFYPSLEEMPFVQQGQAVPVSASISKRILCLPIYESLEESIQDRVIEIVKAKIME